MRRIFQISVFFVFFQFQPVGVCQTDTGGGMGGTGIKESPKAISPANSDEICTGEKSIGLFQIKVAKDKRVKTQGYVCEGQIVQTTANEIAELQLRYGEKITILENSKIRIELPR